MELIDDLFDFSSYDNDNQDVSVLSDNQPPNNGGGFYSQEPFNLFIENDFLTDYEPIKPTPLFSFDHSASQAAGMSVSSEPHYYEGTSGTFSDATFNTDSTSGASQPVRVVSQLMNQQDYNGEVSLVFGSGLPAAPVLATPTIASPAFDSNITYPQIVPLLNSNQAQQWQFIANQQPQMFQPQPRTASVQQLQVVEEQFNLDLQSPLHSPSEERSEHSQSPHERQVTPEYQPTPVYSNLQTPPEVQGSPQKQELLSVEQIRMLQNAGPAEHAQPQRPKTVHPSIRRVDLPPNDSSSSSDDEEEAPKKIARPRKAKPKRTTRAAPGNPPSGYESHHQALPQALLPGLAFTSLRDAEQAMSTRFIESDWTPPDPDNTIPTTQLQRSEYVLMMYEAMQDTSKCKDNPVGFSFLKRWNDTDYYNLQEMEKVCWHMLDIAERLHTQGPTASNMYCEDALKKLKASRLLTFEQRIHAICAMLRFSKNLCDNLMKGEGLEALVGTPKQKMSGAKTMVVQNLKRQKWIVHGRTEEKSNLGELDGDDKSEGVTRKGKKKSKASGAAEKSRTKKKAPAPSSDDDSDEVEETNGLERRQSEFAFRSRSSYNLPDDEDLPTNASKTLANSASSTLTSTSRKHSASSQSPSTPASPPSARLRYETQLTKRATSSEARVPRIEIEAGRARPAAQKAEESNATAKANAHAAAKMDRRLSKRTMEQTALDSEHEQSQSSKRRRSEAASSKRTPPRADKTRASVRLPSGKKSPAYIPKKQRVTKTPTRDQEMTDKESGSEDNSNDTNDGFDNAEETDVEEKAALTPEEDENEAEEQDESEEEEVEEDSEVEEEEGDTTNEESDTVPESHDESKENEPESPSPSPAFKRKTRNSTKRGTTIATRPRATPSRSDMPAKKVTRSTKPALRAIVHLKDKLMKSIKRKRPVEEYAESESDEEPGPSKRAKKTQGSATRKSTRAAARQNSDPANNGEIKQSKPTRNAQGRFIRRNASLESESEAEVEDESEPEVIRRSTRSRPAVLGAHRNLRAGPLDSKGHRRGGK